MTVKEYLARARFINKNIACKKDTIRQLRDMATKATSTLSDGSARASGSAIESLVAKIVDLEHEIDIALGELINSQKETMELINKAPADSQRIILEKRYMQGKSWEKIAAEMNYDRSHVLRLHSAALASLEKFMPEKKDATK